MSPRDAASLDSWITRPANLDPDTCCGCGADCDPDGLCDGCIARREEYGEHDTRCMCAGCGWYRSTQRELAARGLR